MKRFACGSVVPGCAASFQAESEEEIVAQVAEHARDDHGIVSLPAEVEGQVRAQISDA